MNSRNYYDKLYMTKSLMSIRNFIYQIKSNNQLNNIYHKNITYFKNNTSNKQQTKKINNNKSEKISNNIIIRKYGILSLL